MDEHREVAELRRQVARNPVRFLTLDAQSHSVILPRSRGRSP